MRGFPRSGWESRRTESVNAVNDPDSLRLRLTPQPPPSRREAKRLLFQWSWREAPERSSPPSPSLRSPEGAVATRYPRPNPRPSSFVPRKPPPGIQWGRSPLGREEGSRGPFMEWFPGRVFAFFRRAAKEGRSRRSETSLVLFPSFVPAAADNTPVPVIAKPRKGLWQSVTPSIFPSPPQRAILQVSADSQLASAIRFPVPSPPAGNFLCSGGLSSEVQQLLREDLIWSRPVKALARP